MLRPRQSIVPFALGILAAFPAGAAGYRMSVRSVAAGCTLGGLEPTPAKDLVQLDARPGAQFQLEPPRSLCFGLQRGASAEPGGLEASFQVWSDERGVAFEVRFSPDPDGDQPIQVSDPRAFQDFQTWLAESGSQVWLAGPAGTSVELSKVQAGSIRVEAGVPWPSRGASEGALPPLPRGRRSGGVPARWSTRLENLATFIEKFKSLPGAKGGFDLDPTLGIWVRDQRSLDIRGKMPKARSIAFHAVLQRLEGVPGASTVGSRRYGAPGLGESIGNVASGATGGRPRVEDVWDGNLQQLKRFCEKEGRLPLRGKGSTDCPKLAAWTGMQLLHLRKNALLPRRAELLKDALRAVAQSPEGRRSLQVEILALLDSKSGPFPAPVPGPGRGTKRPNAPEDPELPPIPKARRSPSGRIPARPPRQDAAPSSASASPTPLPPDGAASAPAASAAPAGPADASPAPAADLPLPPGPDPSEPQQELLPAQGAMDLEAGTEALFRLPPDPDFDLLEGGWMAADPEDPFKPVLLDGGPAGGALPCAASDDVLFGLDGDESS